MMEFLEPLFVTGAGSNDVDYSHPEFDAALTAAERLATSSCVKGHWELPEP